MLRNVPLAIAAASLTAFGPPAVGRDRPAVPAMAGSGAGQADVVDPEDSRAGEGSAMRAYAWREGASFSLEAVPGRVSDIALETGESLVAVAAGDTVRWVIGDTSSGTGASRRAHVLVKPVSEGLRTNLVITTDRRVYHLDLESSGRTGPAGISWYYPADALLALKRSEAAAPPAPVAEGVSIGALNFAYRIEGDDPPWRPVRAFDDGRQVFIQFPADIATAAAPPLFLLFRDGGTELVNYRMRGRYYVVDRLFSTAELRLGEKRQQVVRIVRSNKMAPKPRPERLP